MCCFIDRFLSKHHDCDVLLGTWTIIIEESEINMTDREILIKFVDKETKGIYGYMYGTQFIRHEHGRGGVHYTESKIIFVNKKELKFWNQKEGNGLYYIWGWPGPDFTVYLFKDYGKTWAFTEEEIDRTPHYPELKTKRE